MKAPDTTPALSLTYTLICSALPQLINAALDISALFDARKDVISRATRFTSKAPPRKILQRIEDAVVSLGGTAKRREASARWDKKSCFSFLATLLHMLCIAQLKNMSADTSYGSSRAAWAQSPCAVINRSS